MLGGGSSKDVLLTYSKGTLRSSFLTIRTQNPQWRRQNLNLIPNHTKSNKCYNRNNLAHCTTGTKEVYY